MIWHQMLMNGLQSTVLTLLAVMLDLVLTEEAVTFTTVITRIAGTASMLCIATVSFLSGVNFICSQKAESKKRKLIPVDRV